MSFTVGTSAVWRREWPNYLAPQKQGVVDFLAIYDVHGLANHTLYPGRVGNSWHNRPVNDPQHIHAKSNNLWHYHIGYPDYKGGQVGPPPWNQTSEYLLHFQWSGNHIKLIELSTHYVRGQFYVPKDEALK